MAKFLQSFLMTTIVTQMVAFTQYDVIDLSTNVHFKEIQFVNDNVGYLTGTITDFTGTTSQMYKTTDGGMNWVLIKEMDIEGQSFHDIEFVSETYGYIGTQSTNNDGVLLVTDDSGQTLYWVTGIPAEEGIRSVDFVNSNIGYVVTNQGNAYKTDNGSQFWTAVSSPASNSEFIKIIAIASNEIFAIVNNAGTDILYRSTNGGSSWSNVYYSNEISLMEKNGTGLLVAQNGNNFTLQQSSNGTSWSNTIYSGVDMIARDIHILDNNHFYLTGKKLSLGSGDFVLMTDDAGSTWNLDTVMVQDTALNAVHFLTSEHGFVAGNRGKFFEYTPLDNVNEFQNRVACRLFPNPATEYIQIESNVVQPFLVQIYDLRGRNMLNQMINPNDQLDVSNFTSGAYFINIYSENQLIKHEKLIIQ